MLLVHPGGPLWARRDEGAWSIPKGEYDEGEEPLAAARREFEEELGTAPPDGERGRPGGGPPEERKVRARLGDRRATSTRPRRVSNTFELEWPPRSGRQIEVPEVDRAEWFGLDAAREKINAAQVALLDRLAELLPGSTLRSELRQRPHRSDRALHRLRLGAQRALAPRARDPRGPGPVRLAAAGHAGQPGDRRRDARVLPARAPPGDRRAARAGDRGRARSAR